MPVVPGRSPEKEQTWCFSSRGRHLESEARRQQEWDISPSTPQMKPVFNSVFSAEGSGEKMLHPTPKKTASSRSARSGWLKTMLPSLTSVWLLHD